MTIDYEFLVRRAHPDGTHEYVAELDLRYSIAEWTTDPTQARIFQAPGWVEYWQGFELVKIEAGIPF